MTSSLVSVLISQRHFFRRHSKAALYVFILTLHSCFSLSDQQCLFRNFLRYWQCAFVLLHVYLCFKKYPLANRFAGACPHICFLLSFRPHYPNSLAYQSLEASKQIFTSTKLSWLHFQEISIRLSRYEHGRTPYASPSIVYIYHLCFSP